MASLSDGTVAGTINSSPWSGASFSPLTGSGNTAKIPDAPAPTSNTQKAATPTNQNDMLAAGYNSGDPTRVAAAKAAGYEPTVLGSSNIDEKNQQNQTKIQGMGVTGQTVGTDGVARNADGSPADAPPGATPIVGEDGNTYYSSGAIKYANSGKMTDDPYTQEIFNQLSALKGQMDATGAANIANIQAQYGSLIEEQKQVNKSQEAGTYALLARGGSLQTESSSGIVQSQISAGVKSIADLIIKEESAKIAAQQAMQDGDMKVLDKQLTIAGDARKERTAAAERISNQIIKEKDALRAKQDAVDTTIKQMITDASGYGAPKDVVKKMEDALASHDWAGAMTAGAGYTKDPTSAAGQYASYVRTATAADQTPMSPTAYMNKLEYNKAYSSAAGAAAGKASVEANTSSQNTIASLSSDKQSALKANGFSAYNASTQDLASQLVNGMIAPSELSKRTTGTSSYNDVLTAANKYSQAVNGKAFDIAKADRNYKFASNPATQSTLNYLSSLVGSDNGTGLAGGNLDQLINASNERKTNYDPNKWGHGFAPSNLPALNDVQQWAKLETGDPNMAAYHAVLLEVSDQVAKVLQGGGTGGGTSDAKLAQAQSLFDSGFTPDQMSAVAGSLKELLSSRAAGMVRDNPYLSDYATQFGVKNVNGVVTTNQKLIADEDTATSKLSAFQNTDPKNKAMIDEIHAQFPDLTASEVAQQLGL